MATLFSKIVAEQIPCYKVAESDEFLAFLDISPLQKGHTLVIPKIEIDYLFDLDDNLLSKMIVFSKNVSRQIKLAFPCERIGVAVVGLEIPHAHIHLIPINTIKDMDFSQPKLLLSPEEFTEIALKIKTN